MGGSPRSQWWRALRERAIEGALLLCAAASIALLVGIFVTLVSRGGRTFTESHGVGRSSLSTEQAALFSPDELAALPEDPPPPPGIFADFLGSGEWNPTGTPPRVGVWSMVVSTLLVTLTSLAISAPLGVSVAAWLAFAAPPWLREWLKPTIEVLAAVPSVVIGFVGMVLVGPALTRVFGIASGLTALNGALLLAIMSLPTIVSLAEDALVAVPRDYLQAALALGADRWQALVQVVLPAARSGIVAALMLGMGRAIGETMTVLMACGNAVAMPTSLFDPVRPLTATIAIELGEAAQGSAQFYVLFAVGTVLFLMTFVVNLVSDLLLQRRQA